MTLATNSRGNYVVGGKRKWAGIWDLFVIIAQYLCKPKSAPQNIALIFWCKVEINLKSYFNDLYTTKRASLVAQSVKNLPVMQKIWVRFLGWEDPLEKEMATHSSILAWRIPMDRGAWQAIQSMGSQESDATQRLNHHHATPLTTGLKHVSQLSICKWHKSTLTVTQAHKIKSCTNEQY